MKPVLILIAGLILIGGVPKFPTAWPWAAPAVTPAAATAAVYVYEKDDHLIPSHVTVGINRLNRERQIVATLLEDDTTDGTGEIPEQYRLALEAARKAGLPAIVAMAGKTVLRVTTDPGTEAAVMEAVP